MIDLTTLGRVRLTRGHHVHAVTPAGGRTTACGKRVYLPGHLTGYRDQALKPTAKVTCPRCIANTDQPEETR